MIDIAELQRRIDGVEDDMAALRAQLNGLSREHSALKTAKLDAEALRDGRVAA